MGELRFILLLAGLLFLVALAAWELRKPRQAQGDAATRDAASRDSTARDGALRGARRREPQMGSMGPIGDAPGGLTEGRRPVTDPRRIDMPELPAMEAMRAESILADADAARAFDSEPHEPLQFTAAATAAVEARPATLTDTSTLEISVTPAEPLPPAVLDWPPEGERHIVALRIVPAANERLSGRAVRLAITACGFVHGRFGIFHQADGEGHALLSVASLAKPGVLDPVNMDFQRLSGLNLFTVLPGPLPPGAALDHLLDTARELSQRLPARVQDESGHPLDAERLEDLRERMQNLA